MPQGSGQNFDFTRAEALTKYVYANKVEELSPDATPTADEFKFSDEAQKLGRKFFMPVEPARSLGVTFNNNGGVFALNRSRSPQDLTAEIMGSEILVRESMSYATMNRALSGDTGTRAGLKAFVQATSHTFRRLSKSGKYFRELALLYGGGAAADSSLGIVGSVVSAVSTTLVIEVTKAEWATAIWAGSENGAFDIFAPGGTKRNTAGSDETSVFVLTGVNSAQRRLTFESNATNVSAVQTGDMIWFEGQRGNECTGMASAALQTTLWNIPTASWNLWKPQTMNVGGMLTFEKAMEGIVKVADIGFNGTINLHVSNSTFKDLADDQASLVRYANKSKGKFELGAEAITYWSPAGSVSIKPNLYMKRGMAMGFPEGMCKRIGSTDITFTLPGYGKMLRELENSAGVESRIYSDQAPFIERPAFFLALTGINDSSS